MKQTGLLLIILTTFIYSCQQQGENQKSSEDKLPKWREPKTLAYKIINAAWWLKDSTISSSQRALVYSINRSDSINFAKMDTVILPVDLSGDIACYLPFPLRVPYLEEIEKVIFFSYATQTFAAYEKGELVHAGPTNMGRENAQTPGGLFFTNWKAKKTISTVNDEWELLWNFNILNKGGVGWHQYEMPGYPASHSCLRLTEADAKRLYTWADQWVLSDKTTIKVKGTPVIVFGNYDFNSPKPWLRLINDPHALDISEKEIKRITEPFLNEILNEQGSRLEYNITQKKDEEVTKGLATE